MSDYDVCNQDTKQLIKTKQQKLSQDSRVQVPYNDNGL